MKSSRLLLVAATALLLTAVGLVAYGSTLIPEPDFSGTLSEVLPAPPPGWAKKEKPIADSLEMQEAVNAILNFDDGVFVDYTRPNGKRLSIYMAYWTPGKMNYRDIASHTPDNCWVHAGWIKESEDKLNSFTLEYNGVVLRIPGGQSRVFSSNSNREYVWYWHITGATSKTYGGRTPPWHALITDILSTGLKQREEQFFIRISSNDPLEQILLDDLAVILKDLPWPKSPAATGKSVGTN